jgi:hypothetical protein
MSTNKASFLVLSLFVLALLASAAPARAQGFIALFAGYNFGGDAGCPEITGCEDKRLNAGMAIGRMGALFGSEQEPLEDHGRRHSASGHAERPGDGRHRGLALRQRPDCAAVRGGYGRVPERPDPRTHVRSREGLLFRWCGPASSAGASTSTRRSACETFGWLPSVPSSCLAGERVAWVERDRLIQEHART